MGCEVYKGGLMLNPLETANRHLVNPTPPQEQKEMAVTFNITGSYGYAYIPIGNEDSGTQEHNIKIDWGDGQTTEIEAGTSMAKNITSHKYSTDKGYVTVKITSEDGILPKWHSITTSNYWSGTKANSSSFTNWPVRYETPILKIENTSEFTLGGPSSHVEYMDDYLLKNNSHLVTFSPYLRNYEKIKSETSDGDTFKLNRSILLDLPNLQSIHDWGGLICGEQNFDKDTLFNNCLNLEQATLDVNYQYFYFPDKRFPDLFKKTNKLKCVGRNSTKTNTYAGGTTDPWILSQIETIPGELFKNCPKIEQMSGIFSGQCQNLQTSNISFTKGGFFAENWTPEGQVRADSMLAIMTTNTVNTGNALEFANTIIEASNSNYFVKGALYGHSSMEGYSEILGAFKRSPY